MSTTTIWSVLNNNVSEYDIKRGIEIPMIQRDYAQGRDNDKAGEIRKVFLHKIHNSIDEVVNKGRLIPLELDFVYGFLEADAFVPLDGQQRLTTLYILHWYFAFKEQKLQEYKTPFSRFTYQTRQSSTDFFKKINNELTESDHEDVFVNGQSFESVITNKNWYFVSWKYDLTIQSAIKMLDEIHLSFKDSSITLQDLTDNEKPPIVFNFLDIKNFGLSDDLYIKMNARGKPLTNFENLKAELSKYIELSDFNKKYSYQLKHSSGYKDVDVETYFATKTDTYWSDFFWKIRNAETNEFDDKLLNLLAFVSLNELIRVDLSRFDESINELDKSNSELSYYKFLHLKLLGEDSIITYINILDLLVSDDVTIKTYLSDLQYLNKPSIIKSSYEDNFKARYEQRILFYAVFKFLIANKGSVTSEELLKWDRLIKNLVTNTLYPSSKIFQESIISIDELIAAYDGDIYQTFLNLNIKGFDTQQIKEEKLKIELLLKSPDWEDFILAAEKHGYLDGQIISLLSFSGIYDKYLDADLNWDSDQQEQYLNTIKLYYDKFNAAFSDKGLKPFEQEQFRRALLTKGDYLLYSTNWSLLIDNHRDISWKRLFKDTGNRTNKDSMRRSNYVKQLFDDIDASDIVASLESIIKNHTQTDWKKDFIDYPILIKSSKEKYLKFFDNGDIYVLRTTKYYKNADPEVKAILLKRALVSRGFSNNDIELGYIDNLYQYGIVRIKNYKPKVVYNYDGNGKFLFKQKGKDDLYFDTATEVETYLADNF